MSEGPWSMRERGAPAYRTMDAVAGRGAVGRTAGGLFALALVAARRLAGRRAPALDAVAERTWQIAPGSRATARPALFLPGQLERVTGWAFASEHPARAMAGGFSVIHAPTMAFLVRNAWLIDGVVHDGRALLRLHARSRRWPPLLAPEIVARGAIFCTATGNRYFGQWLMDDCATYPLAVAEGAPITTAQPVNVHTLDYEQRLDMRPRRVGSAYVPELVIFHDVGQNPDKRRRVQAMRDRLFPAGGGAEHAGVFILRGATGQRRVLRNELELAERLRDRRGLRIVDPARADVETIVRTCAGARMVVGVEGSGLMHGILALRAGGAIVTLQPPSRFVGLYKDLADRDDQAFAFVVGLPEGEDFRVDPDEVERTLDLLPG